MSRPLNNVFYGDWLTASQALKSDSESANKSIASALGLAWKDVDKAIHDDDSVERANTTSGEKKSAIESVHQDTRNALQDLKIDFEEQQQQPLAESEVSLLEPTETEQVSIEKFLGDDWRIAEDVIWSDSSASEESLSKIPLLEKNKCLGVFSQALKVKRNTHQLDIDGAISIIASGKCLHEVPLLERADLFHGVQVLIDRDESMQPFWEDQQQLLIQLERIVGRHRMDVFTFRGDPFQGARKTGLSSYQFPPPRRPILVVTDAGMGYGVASTDVEFDWPEKLLVASKLNGNRVIFLSPIPQFVYPDRWMRGAIWLHWDRSLSIRDFLFGS